MNHSENGSERRKSLWANTFPRPGMPLEYEVSYDMIHGCYRCSKCRAEFYGEGSAVHSDVCTERGYGSCVLVIGPEIVKNVKAWAAEHGTSKVEPNSGICLDFLIKQLPYLR